MPQSNTWQELKLCDLPRTFGSAQIAAIYYLSFLYRHLLEGEKKATTAQNHEKNPTQPVSFTAVLCPPAGHELSQLALLKTLHQLQHQRATPQTQSQAAVWYLMNFIFLKNYKHITTEK